MRHLFSNTHFDFIGVRKFAYLLTAAFFIPGLVLLLVRGLNYSIEFTGGTLVQVTSKVPVNVGDLAPRARRPRACRAPRSRRSAATGST